MKLTTMNEETLARVSTLFGALSNPTRLRIVELLSGQERTVGDVAESLRIGQSGASQHLAILARAGVVVASARGTSRLYRLRGPRIVQILDLIEEFCHVHQLYGSADETEELGRGDRRH